MSVEKEIGELLRKAREAMGLSLNQLQEKTKIQKSFIEAIENGEFNKLPSPFYVRTYLRAYCKCVKIEPHHILRQYRKAEQAERGLTSVQPAITPELQAQLQQQQTLQGNVHMIHQNGRMMGAQRSFAQAARRNTTNQTTRRTNLNTALTIAKKSSLPNQQRMHQVEASKLQNETILTPRKNLEQTTKSNYDFTNKQTSSLRISSNLDKNQRRERSQRSFNQATYVDKKMPYSNEKRKQALHASANRTEHTANRSYHQKNHFASNQSKDVRAKTNPSGIERRKLSADSSKQEVTKMPKLSRSSARRSRRSERNGSFRWANKKTLLILASLVICIPLLWATVNALATDDEKEKNRNNKPVVKTDQSKEQEQTPNDESTQNEQPAEDQIVLTSSSPQLNTYEVSGTDQLNLKFRAQGESWIQVRKQPQPQKEGYLDEATLQNGHEDSYSHNFADGKEIWISLGIPEYVVVTVNGKQIKSSKTIHIKQK